MKSLKYIFLFLIAAGISLPATAQKKYDEIKYPELRNFKKPNVELFSLDNGITFYLVEDNELPLINLSLTVRTGSILEPVEKTGLAGILGQVMRSGGSKSYPADKLNVLLEDKAASIETFVGFSSGGASMNILKEDFDEVLAAFIDLIQNPLLPEDKIELAKTQTKSSISRRNDNQAGIASREFRKLIYGENSVYTRQTEFETIDSITREDLVQFHKDAFVGSNMIIGVIGDFKAKEIKQKLSSAFGSIPAGSETNIIFPEVNYNYPATVNFIDKQDVNQSYVMLGHIGGLREDPDYAALQVMNQILSGGFAGRLFQKVRTDLGLAYSVGGGFGSNISYPGQFSATVMTKSETTAEAIDAIIVELKRLQDEIVTDTELQETKERFLNSLVFRYDSKAKVLNEQINNDYLGLPQDAFDKYVDQIKKVTPADIQRVAKKHLRPDRLQILVVGNGAEIGEQLQKYGTVKPIDIEIPMPRSDEVVESGDTVKGKEWLTKMASAIIPGYSEKSTVTAKQINLQGGAEIPTTSTTNYRENTIEATLSTPQGDFGVSFKNGSGTLSLMGSTQPLPPAFAANFKEQVEGSFLSVTIHAEKTESEFLGMENTDGKELVKLRVKLDKNYTYYLNPGTALIEKVEYVQFVSQLGQNVNFLIKFIDWKEFDGIKHPATIEVYSNGNLATTTKTNSISVN